MLSLEHGPVNTLISDFQPPELWENKFLLFQAIQFVIFVTGALGSQYTSFFLLVKIFQNVNDVNLLFSLENKD